MPLIHNVMNTDVVVGVSDQRDRHALRAVQHRRGPQLSASSGAASTRALVARLGHFGFSGICNMLAAIKTAKYFDLGPDDVILTVATDGAAMYGSEVRQGDRRAISATASTRSPPARPAGRSMLGAATDHLLELGHVDRKRVFNLGYFTWVEQQGVSLEDFRRAREAVVLGRPRSNSRPRGTR